MNKKPVLFLGEINVDLIFNGLLRHPEIDKEVACRDFTITIGSSTAICAAAFSALGGGAAFYGLAGKDYFGDFMVRQLISCGVDTSEVEISEKVKTGVTANLNKGHTRSQVTYPGSMALFSAEKADKAFLGRFSHVHCSGIYLQESLLPRLPDIYCRARDGGLTTSLDTQWDGSEKWLFLDKILPCLDYLFVNYDEALSIAGTPDIEKALSILTKYDTAAVIKRGEMGAYFRGQSGDTVLLPTEPLDPVDTTGAGDNFDAGFLYARLIGNYDLEKAIGFAHKAAAAGCRSTGGVAELSEYRTLSKKEAIK